MIPKYFPFSNMLVERKIKELVGWYYKNGVETSTVFEDGPNGYDYKKGKVTALGIFNKGKEKELVIQTNLKDEFITFLIKPLNKNLHGLPFKIKQDSGRLMSMLI